MVRRGAKKKQAWQESSWHSMVAGVGPKHACWAAGDTQELDLSGLYRHEGS